LKLKQIQLNEIQSHKLQKKKVSSSLSPSLISTLDLKCYSLALTLIDLTKEESPSRLDTPLPNLKKVSTPINMKLNQR